MEKETLDPIPVESSTLNDVAYDTERRRLVLTFASGSVYEYADVPATVARDLLQAESKGRYFNAHIRDQYRFSRHV
jgi:lysyl-tRNA synthetase class 2